MAQYATTIELACDGNSAFEWEDSSQQAEFGSVKENKSQHSPKSESIHFVSAYMCTLGQKINLAASTLNDWKQALSVVRLKVAPIIGSLKVTSGK